MENNGAGNGNYNHLLPNGDSKSSEGFLAIALRHRWTILITLVMCLAAMAAYLLKATPIYTSDSRLYVEQSGPRIIGEFEGIMTQSKNYLYTQGELIGSTPILSAVLEEDRIKRFRTFADVDNEMAVLRANLNVSVGKKDDIITVSFDSPYPVEAAEIANAIVKSYIDYHSTRKRSTVSEVVRILAKEKVKRDQELSKKFDEMLQFTKDNGVVSLDGQGTPVVLERLNKLSAALTAAQLDTLNAKADYEAASSVADEPLRVKQYAAASPTAQVTSLIEDRETQLRAELREAEIELETARYHCTEDHPSVQAIHSKIDRIRSELNEQAKEFADAYVEAMRLRWQTASERELELQTSFDEQLAAARDLGIKATEYSVLQSELERLERLTEILDDRIKELNVTEDVGALNISIMEVARPSENPSKPEKGKMMALAMVLGLMMGGGLVVARDTMDYRLRSAEEVTMVLGAPVLGVIPTMNGSQASLSGGRFWGRLKLLVGAGNGKELRQLATRSNLAEKPSDSSKLVKSKVFNRYDVVNRGQRASLKPKSVVSEAYRTVRTALFFGIPKEDARLILVTSPAPGDGKSTLASNLAITIAQAGQKTLILDADFRKPMQHNIFEIDRQTEGLANVLAGTVELERALHATSVEGLDIMHCGAEIPNPAEVLNSKAFGDLLKDLSKRYDRIIVDSPPVSMVADSQILAAQCDTTLLVLRAEKSTRKHSQQARDSILAVGGHILGAVVNDVHRKHNGYGYGYGYGGYGYYGSYGNGDSEKNAG